MSSVGERIPAPILEVDNETEEEGSNSAEDDDFSIDDSSQETASDNASDDSFCSSDSVSSDTVVDGNNGLSKQKVRSTKRKIGAKTGWMRSGQHLLR